MKKLIPYILGGFVMGLLVVSMNTPMQSIVWGSFFFGIGSYQIVFHKHFAKRCANQRSWFWQPKYSPAMIKVTEIISIVVGTIFCAAGIEIWLGKL